MYHIHATWTQGLIEDSNVSEQIVNFVNENKQNRKVKSYPGSKAKKVEEEVCKLKQKVGTDVS